MKHILSIQDLSCVGRCSLTVAQPVLSAMGLRCSVLPTAILSTHTAFPDPRVCSLTEQLRPFASHWAQLGVAFDGISVGYLSDPDQAQAVSDILTLLHAPLVIVDPVLGDGGRLYSRMTQAHLQAAKSLCRQADVLVPNLTEASFLTGLPYRAHPDEGQRRQLLDALLALAPSAVITGISDEETVEIIGGKRGESPFFWQGERIPRQFHGTGDLFAAVLSGSLLQGASLVAAAARAGEFVRCCVEGTPVQSPHGVEFERELGRLVQE